jgi:hypothetical protein
MAKDEREPRWVGLQVLVLLLLMVLYAFGAFGQGVPRRHISASRELCSGTKCLVVYEADEHQNEPCYVSLWCNATTPCTVTQTLYAGWQQDMVWKYTIPPGGFIGWEGVYPYEFRIYVGNGRLPWRIEGEGIRAWEAYETAGDYTAEGKYVWPVKHLLKPVKVEVTQ